jgi:uncharacterized protein
VAESKESVKVAAVGDVHRGLEPRSRLRDIFARAAEQADVLALCGDLTDSGLPDEAKALAQDLKAATEKIPVIGVLGNHDWEAGRHEEVRKILADAA